MDTLSQLFYFIFSFKLVEIACDLLSSALRDGPSHGT